MRRCCVRSPAGRLEVADLMRHHGVLALRDFTLPPAAPPLAVAAFAFIGWPGTPSWPVSGSGCTCAGEAWAAGS